MVEQASPQFEGLLYSVVIRRIFCIWNLLFRGEHYTVQATD